MAAELAERPGSTGVVSGAPPDGLTRSLTVGVRCSVMHAVKMIETRLGTDAEFARSVVAIEHPFKVSGG